MKKQTNSPVSKDERLGGNKDTSTKPKEVGDNIGKPQDTLIKELQQVEEEIKKLRKQGYVSSADNEISLDKDWINFIKKNSYKKGLQQAISIADEYEKEIKELKENSEYLRDCIKSYADRLKCVIHEKDELLKDEIELLKEIVDNDNGEECDCEFCSRIKKLEQQLNSSQNKK